MARSARLLPGEWDGLLTLTVALSMALTPLLLIVLERVDARRTEGEREADAIDDAHAPVIIAGFGRFGQIVGRLLFAAGFKATVLDHDPDQIELLRRFDFRVYFGDATRTDLLESAGIAEARLLVNAIDDPTQSVALVDAIRAHFPRCRILARARNVGHYFELRRRGVEVVERETFESALRLGRHALAALGVDPYEAREAAERFRRHNVSMIEAAVPPEQSEEERRAVARAARDELERQMEQDRAERTRLGAQGWHALDGADEARS